MPVPDAEYRLDDEQRAQIRDCLNKAGLVPARCDVERLVRDVERSIAKFLHAEPAGTFRDTSDALRALWFLSHRADPPIGLLRARIAKLPPRALAAIERRAPVVIARLLGIPIVWLLLNNPRDLGFLGFCEWSRTASPRLLVRATRVLSADGAERVEGRRRGPDKRSADHLEPRILGEVRGLGPRIDRRGRPPPDARQDLVVDLAMAWRRATGGGAAPGRSDHGGFGELVYRVFDWVGLSAGSAEHLLRQHWTEVEDRVAEMEKRRARPPLPDFAAI